jgi:hypothetical protein
MITQVKRVCNWPSYTLCLQSSSNWYFVYWYSVISTGSDVGRRT